MNAIVALHAAAPAGGGHWTGTHNEDWTQGKPVPAMPREAVFMGDFNLTPASPLYAKIAGPFSPEYGRMNNLKGFADTWVAAGLPAIRRDALLLRPDDAFLLPRGHPRRLEAIQADIEAQVR